MQRSWRHSSKAQLLDAEKLETRLKAQFLHAEMLRTQLQKAEKLETQLLNAEKLETQLQGTAP